jgi:hypothetical protein
MLKTLTNEKEIWNINLACAKRCLHRKLTLKEINSLVARGITELTRDNIVQICADKNIQLTLID